MGKKQGIELRYIQPGKPTQNGLIERLNGTLRTECLNLEWFASIENLDNKLQQWPVIYNRKRPHSAIKYMTPAQYEDKNPILCFKMVA